MDNEHPAIQQHASGQHVYQFGVAYGNLTIIQPPGEAPVPALRNPYKALRPFTLSDANDFFGRDALIRELQDRLCPPEQHQPGSRFVAVIGASGSGKSSLVQAGLFPRLLNDKDAVPGVTLWHIVLAQPGQRPLEKLATQLNLVGGLAALLPSDIERELRADERGLHRLAERGLGAQAADRLLLVVDQFEELYTLTPEAERMAFLESLLTAVDDPEGRSVAVVTARADFYGELAQHPTLRAWLHERQLIVGPMEEHELRRTITGPAEGVGLRFEAGLVDRILADVKAQPGALPLMQVALSQLYDHQQDRVLTDAAYDQIGGVAGALNQRAEQLYTGLEPGQQALVRGAIVQMVRLGEKDTSLSRTGHELTPQGTDPVQVEGALEPFVRSRLLTSSLDEAMAARTYVISHQALIGNWRRLQLWLDGDRSFLLWRQRLGAALEEWQRRAQHDDFLLRGAFLAEAEANLQERERDLQSGQLEFIQESIKHRDQRMRRRRLAFAGAMMFLVATAFAMAGLAVFGFDQANEANTQATRVAQERDNAWNSQALFLASRAQQELDAGLPQNALLLALESLEHYPQGIYRVESGRALLDTLTYPVQEVAHLQHFGSIINAVWNSDGTRLLLWDNAGAVWVWDINSGATLTTMRHGGWVNSATWNDSESSVLTSSGDGTARVWDVESGNQRLILRHYGVDGLGLPVGVSDAAWSPGERRILTVSTDDSVRIWDASDGQALAVLYHDADVQGASWNKDATCILTWSDDGTARVWDAENGNERFALRHERPVNGALWNADESRVLTWSSDASVRVWDGESGEELLALRHDEGQYDWQNAVNGAAWNADDSQILTWSQDGTARVWDSQSGTQRLMLQHTVDEYGQLGSVHYASWNRDESRILTRSNDNTARVWDAASGDALFTLRHAGEDTYGQPIAVIDASWNGDESRVLTLSSEGEVGIWNAQSGALLWMLPPVEEVSFWNPTGLRLLTWSNFLDPGVGLSTLRLWGATWHEQLHPLSFSETPESHRVWHASTGQMLTWSGQGVIQVWDVESGASLLTRDLEGPIDGVAWNTDGTRVLAWAGSLVRLWELSSGEALLTLDHEGDVSSVTWSPDESRLLTAGSDVVRAWNAVSGDALLTMSGRSPVWSADSQRFLVTALDSTIQAWDSVSGEALFTLHLDGGVVYQARLWGVRWNTRGTRILTWSGIIFTTSDTELPRPDNTTRMWDGQTGAELFSVPYGCQALLNAGETRLLTWCGQDLGAGNAELQVWDASNGLLLDTLYRGEWINGIAWSDDGSHILFWLPDGTARVWDSERSEEVLVLNAEGEIVAAAWNSDERYLFTQSQDGLFQVWVASSGEELLRTAGIRSARWVGESSDILGSLDDGSVWVFPVDVAQLIEVGRAQVVDLLSNEERAQVYLPTLDPTVSFTAVPTVTPLPTGTPASTQPAIIGPNRGEVTVGGGEVWRYAGTAGEVLTIRVNAGNPTNNATDQARRQQGLLDTRVIIHDPAGGILIEADDIDAGVLTNSLIENLELPVDGAYEIEVRSWEDASGGAYTLVIESSRTGATMPTASPTPNSSSTRP